MEHQQLEIFNSGALETDGTQFDASLASATELSGNPDLDLDILLARQSGQARELSPDGELNALLAQHDIHNQSDPPQPIDAVSYDPSQPSNFGLALFFFSRIISLDLEPDGSFIFFWVS